MAMSTTSGYYFSFSMAAHIISIAALLALQLVLVVPSASAAVDADDVSTAVRQMQRANYFTFVTLINMVRDQLPANATYLLASDRKLSQLPLPENRVADFLATYSIPSPLSFDDLARLPSGTLLPTFKTGYAIAVSSRGDGTGKLYLNDVQLVRPDVCAGAGAPFRCHGIGGFLWNQTSAGDGGAEAPAPAYPGAGPPSPAAEPSPAGAAGPAAAPGPSPAADSRTSGAVRLTGADAAAAALTSLPVLAFMRLLLH